MVILKKIKAASLTEVLVATTIILLVFGIAIATLNNILQSSTHQNIQGITTQLHKLQYQYKNHQIKTPYYSQYKDWSISIQKDNSNTSVIVFEAEHKTSQKNITKKITAIETH